MLVNKMTMCDMQQQNQSLSKNLHDFISITKSLNDYMKRDKNQHKKLDEIISLCNQHVYELKSILKKM